MKAVLSSDAVRLLDAAGIAAQGTEESMAVAFRGREP